VGVAVGVALDVAVDDFHVGSNGSEHRAHWVLRDCSRWLSVLPYSGVL